MNASRLKHFSATNLFIGVITLLLIILAFVPYAVVFNPADYAPEDYWRPSYIWSDPVLIILYISFAVLWIAFLFVKHPKARKVILAGLLVVSFCWFGFSSAVFVFAMQDFTISYGICISFLLFPGFILYLAIISILNRSKKPEVENS